MKRCQRNNVSDSSECSDSSDSSDKMVMVVTAVTVVTEVMVLIVMVVLRVQRGGLLAMSVYAVVIIVMAIWLIVLCMHSTCVAELFLVYLLSWLCNWTDSTSLTPDPEGEERIAYVATCMRRTHLCKQSASDPGHSDNEQPDEGTEQSHSEQSGTSSSSAMQTACPSRSRSSRGTTVAVALPHLPRRLWMTHSPFEQH